MGGHGTSMGGILIEGGKFNWNKNNKFPSMTNPYEGYHGLSFSEEFGPVAFSMKARAEGMHNFGPAISPTNAFNIIQGLETLPIRFKKHQENTKKVAEYLLNNKIVNKVIYPGFHLGEDKKRVEKYLKNGNGSLIGFELKGGLEAGIKFIDKLKLFYHVANIGDCRSLAIHPSSTTHSQLSEKDQLRSGVFA